MNPLLALFIRFALTSLGILVTPMPRGMELKAGALLGRILLRVDPRRRRIAEENMRRCLPELGPEGLGRLLRKNYEHYGILALEILHMFSPFPGHYRAYARRVSVLEGYENWRRAHDKGKGVLVVSAHLANWELLAAAAALGGVPATMVTRHLKPEWLHEKIRLARLSAGVKCVYLPNTIPAVMKALRKGESVGFVMDQYAPPPAGIPVPFFGVTVDTLAAVAPLALRTGAAIVPAKQTRGDDGLVHVEFEPELDLGEDLRDPSKATERLAAKVEQWIRAEPAQWLWVHRRFKNLRAP